VAGLLAAFTVPFHGAYSPLRTLEAVLHPWVAFFVLPVFAFANAGVSFTNATIDVFSSPVMLGIVLGLIVGKQIGTFGFGLVLIRMGWARLPERTSWTMFFGTCVLTGIGFTMSLFIGGLAFDEFSREVEVRTAVIAASLLSACAGLTVLVWATCVAGGGQDSETDSRRST
jgi:NhaA family Na+:H+ antiporter